MVETIIQFTLYLLSSASEGSVTRQQQTGCHEGVACTPVVFTQLQQQNVPMRCLHDGTLKLLESAS
jgi:hypothetical protein